MRMNFNVASTKGWKHTHKKADGMSMGPNDAFAKIVSTLPLTTYRAGDTILAAGSKTGRILILKTGSVVVLNGSTEIARVNHPGAVIGEIAALLDLPHTADVRALTDSQFHVADATLIDNDPAASRHVARILARRIVEANKNFAELRSQMQTGQSPGVLSKILQRMEEILSVGGAAYET
jgi:CRP/FNR family transcriptional regulator, cyclic AMP receptor protein